MEPQAIEQGVPERVSRFSGLPEAVRALWAKSLPPGHGLLAHLLDVAAVAETLLLRESEAALRWAGGLFGLPSESLPRWIGALAGLHDFGKASVGFQNKWPEGRFRAATAGLDFPSRLLRPEVSRHDCSSAALLRPLLAQTGLAPGWVRGVVQAISAHHGYHLRDDEIRSHLPSDGPGWKNARQILFESYWATLRPRDQPVAETLPLPAVDWLAGLTSVADWIGSNTNWFPPGERADELLRHHADALERARKALDTIGWSSVQILAARPQSTEMRLARICGVPRPMPPRPLQAEGERLLDGAHGPSLLMVEAPMGEGKTELALLAHLQLQATNGHRGLYMALPTQATGNAMFSRVHTFLAAFAGDVRLDLQLAHGAAGLNEEVIRLRGVHDDGQHGGGDVAASAWFAQRRRSLLSPYGVGTIDQALLSVLNVKHHFVPLWGLANRVVVLDEVHAYDTYTSGLIEALLRWLKALGCSVVLMSATLPAQRRAALLSAWGVNGNGATLELPYPRLLLADDRGVRNATFSSRQMPDVALEAIGESIDELVDAALGCARGCGCGAVIVNTVDRAQQLYCRLMAELPAGTTLLLFHARYPADERGFRERAVLAAFGAGNARPERALLIATQVAEQSLDLDFDYLISDLAPMDLLLQRAGRLHRHSRTRPSAHRQARLRVAGLDPARFPDLRTTRWEHVYAPFVLGRTWALLSRESVLRMPQDIDRLVQAVYGGTELPDSIDPEIRDLIDIRYQGEYLGKRQREDQLAVNAAIDPDAEPHLVYASKPRANEEGEGMRGQGAWLHAKTRLGDEGVAVVPVHAGRDGWCVHPGETAFDPDRCLDDALARCLVARQMRLNRKSLKLALAAQTLPRCFAEHPWLCHLHPLLLVDGRARIDSTELRLDPELGIVYAANESLPSPERHA